MGVGNKLNQSGGGTVMSSSTLPTTQKESIASSSLSILLMGFEQKLRGLPFSCHALTALSSSHSSKCVLRIPSSSKCCPKHVCDCVSLLFLKEMVQEDLVLQYWDVQQNYFVKQNTYNHIYFSFTNIYHEYVDDIFWEKALGSKILAFFWKVIQHIKEQRIYIYSKIPFTSQSEQGNVSLAICHFLSRRIHT